MKYSKQHYEQLKAAINSLLKKHGITAMEVYNARGNMSDTRFAWDLFWASGLYKDDNFRDAGYLDTHTSTALKRVFAELGLNLNIK